MTQHALVNQDYQPHHVKDFQDSAIDADIIHLNFRTSSGAEIFDTLYPNPKRLNTGTLSSWYLKLYYYWTEKTGWICQGIDPVTMLPSEWGCIKPDQPRFNKKERKKIKYEHPRDIPLEVFCLRVSFRIGLKCAQKAGLLAEKSYLDRISLIDDMTAEDTGFWQWIKDNPSIKIVLTEGAKKAGGMLSAGYIAIGLPGIYSGYRSKINGVPCIPHLIPQLEVFAHPDREIVFAFDRDLKASTIKAVKTATIRTARLLQRQGCNTTVMSWDIPAKGIDDLIVAIGENGLDRVWSDRLSPDRWQLASTFDLSRYGATKVDSRYLTDAGIVLPDLTGRIIAVKSPKGTGKTELSAQQITPAIERGQSVLVVTHRIQLAKALADRFGINHIEEVRSSATGGLFGYALCVDSLHPKSQARFNPEAWEGAVIVIDEAEQVLWHMLNSNTCKSNRVAILETFERLMTTVANSGGTIYLSDADLSPVSIEYIRTLTNHQMPLSLIINTHNPNQGKRKLITYKNEGQLVKQAMVAIERGENIIIHCSSQKVKSTWSPQNIHKVLLKHFPKLKVLIIDRETVAEKGHPAYGCIEHINQVVTDYQVVLASPTIETGISIDGSHFNSVWAIANGVQTVDGFCQTIERVRADVPRHICISDRAIQRIGNGGISIKSLLRSEHQAYKANYTVLSRLEDLAKEDDRSPTHLNTWGCFAAKVNLGFKDYAGEILTKLQIEGYEVEDFNLNPSSTPDSDRDIDKEIETARDENYQAEIDEIIAAPNPSEIEYKALKKARAKTKAERHAEAKGGLCRRYLTEDITIDLIRKDDVGWYPQIRLHYYLTLGRGLVEDRDNAKLEALAPGAQPFKPDSNRSTLTLKVRLLEALDIPQFFRDDRTFTADSLAEWHSKIIRHRWNIKDVLGITINDKLTPIQAAQKILRVIGCQLEYFDRIRIDGLLVRRYVWADCNPDGRVEIFDRWLRAEMAECSTSLYRSNNVASGTPVEVA